jgi:hypothetical protein
MRGRSCAFRWTRRRILAWTLTCTALVAGAAQADVVSVRVHTEPADVGAPLAVANGIAKAADAPAVRAVAVVIPRGHVVTAVTAHAASYVPWQGPASNAAVATLDAAVTGIGSWRGWSVATVQLHPVVRGANGIDLATDIDLELHTSARRRDAADTLARRCRARCARRGARRRLRGQSRCRTALRAAPSGAS